MGQTNPNVQHNLSASLFKKPSTGRGKIGVCVRNQLPLSSTPSRVRRIPVPKKNKNLKKRGDKKKKVGWGIRGVKGSLGSRKVGEPGTS